MSMYRSIPLGLLTLAAIACGGQDPIEIGDPASGEEEAPALADETQLTHSDVAIEPGPIADLYAISARIAAEPSAQGEVPKSCARPIGWHSDKVIGEMNMGFWPNQDSFCRDWGYCPDGTYAYSISLKSMPSGGGDNLAVTGIAVSCHNPITGAYITWATPKASADAPGTWDASPVCNLGSPLWGGRLRLMTGPTSNSDDFGVTDGRGVCSDGTAVDSTVNNPETWGSWQSYAYCPSGKRVCAVTNKVDPDDSSDDAGLTGVKVMCCDYS
jgi:hypothetical protein